MHLSSCWYIINIFCLLQAVKLTFKYHLGVSFTFPLLTPVLMPIKLVFLTSPNHKRHRTWPSLYLNGSTLTQVGQKTILLQNTIILIGRPPASLSRYISSRLLYMVMVEYKSRVYKSEWWLIRKWYYNVYINFQMYKVLIFIMGTG